MSYIVFMSSLYQTNKHQIACEPTWRAVVSTKWFVSNSGFQLTAFLLSSRVVGNLLLNKSKVNVLMCKSYTNTWFCNHVLVRTSASSAFRRISFVGSQTKNLESFCPWRNRLYLILIVTSSLRHAVKKPGYFTVRLAVSVDPPPYTLRSAFCDF